MKTLSVQASDYSLGQLCDILNAAYGGYVMPVAFEPAALMQRIQAEHIDLTQSSVFTTMQGEPAAVSIISRRGSTSRVSALGVLPQFRGAGLGATAIEWCLAQARARNDRHQVLEVIDGNSAAMATYLRAGFRTTRRLVGYTHEASGGGEQLQMCSNLEAMAVLVSAYAKTTTWQASPLCFSAARPPLKAYCNDSRTAVAIIDAGAPIVKLLAFAVLPSVARRGVGSCFMKSLLGAFPQRNWRVPEYFAADDGEAFLKKTGWVLSSIKQLEMVHTLR
ncbi:GNAT family N-acetyltransferase [Sulfitobacter delicatus]|uniref:Ribosomal protein S18 acetylase RimI n=1 Tax=Sulfitobacter delicatus TaxID=218672 RepID=A0A1G7KG88_9RHOB|nr:GNAT family N-acetyltransferase [Sulfitobacter delicatus]SDF36197.1 Ribosomal protein S18 acetylase RimI [Sulfitobacter delicatus]